MYDKNRVLKDLIDLCYANGLHAGRWEEDARMDLSASEFLETMIVFADEYKIDYDQDLSHYIEFEDEDKHYTEETMAYDIYKKVERKLIEILHESL